MTSADFNEKYKDYLEEGFYGLDINVPELTKFLDSKFQEYIKIPYFKYSQIKVKFGYIRIYCTLMDAEIRHLEYACQALYNIYKNKDTVFTNTKKEIK